MLLRAKDSRLIHFVHKANQAHTLAASDYSLVKEHEQTHQTAFAG